MKEQLSWSRRRRGRHRAGRPEGVGQLRPPGIAFGEAATALLGADVFIRVNREHGREDRLVSVGFSRRGRRLTVVTAEPAVGEIRIIPAWRATKRERNADERRSF